MHKGLKNNLLKLQGKYIVDVTQIDDDIIVEFSDGSSLVIGMKAKAHIDLLINTAGKKGA